ncbi:MAG: hypothetical protein Tsb0010_11640 [Parvularculaceae bacterium]
MVLKLPSFLRFCAAWRLALTLGAALLTAAPQLALAQASILERAEAQCEIGEGADGYLHVRAEEIAPDLARAVAAANGARRTRFAALAREEGVAAAVIAERTGRELIGELPAGRCYLTADGQWMVKE